MYIKCKNKETSIYLQKSLVKHKCCDFLCKDRIIENKIFVIIFPPRYIPCSHHGLHFSIGKTSEEYFNFIKQYNPDCEHCPICKKPIQEGDLPVILSTDRKQKIFGEKFMSSEDTARFFGIIKAME